MRASVPLRLSTRKGSVKPLDSEGLGSLAGVTFGERLREWRDRRKLTQDQLARRIGVHRMTIAKLEAGQRAAPSAETLRDLAKALRVSMAALLGSTNPETEKALQDYEGSPYYLQLVDEGNPIEEAEREFLRYVIESVWAEGKPTPKALHHILLAYRLSPELRECSGDH